MSALQEFLEQAAIVEMDTAHKGAVAFGRPFVARMATEIRDMAAIGSAMRSVIAAAEQRANDAEQERAAVIDAFNTMQIANKQTHELWLTRTALLVETLRSLARVSMSDQEYITCPSCGMFLWRHDADCPVRAIMELPAFSPRTALTAPATQPNERAVAEREVIAAARPVLGMLRGTHSAFNQVIYVQALTDALSALDALDRKTDIAVQDAENAV